MKLNISTTMKAVLLTTLTVFIIAVLLFLLVSYPADFVFICVLLGIISFIGYGIYKLYLLALQVIIDYEESKR